jgi:diaminopimelate decarboxylase
MFTQSEGVWSLRQTEGIWSLQSLAEKSPRPFYVYDLDDALARADRFLKSGAHIHYAMKANSLPRLIRAFAARGLGVDVVSLGEMQLALASGVSPRKIIFSGVAKGPEELRAAVGHRILQINVESFEELQALEQIARDSGTSADVALRLNIHLEAPTHKHIQTATSASKFGLDIRQLGSALDWLKTHPALRLKSLAVHIGSQILDVSAFQAASQTMGELFKDVAQQGFPIERLDLGGGLGLDYKTTGEEDFHRLDHYLDTVMTAHKSPARLILEPGRFLVARMGVLLAQVVYVKRALERNFLILNAGMNCLMRPALYQAYHRIEPLYVRDPDDRETYTIVGPICESTDVFADARNLPRMRPGDWVGVFEAGAYGAVMANTYNESQLPSQWSVLNGKWEVL